MLYMELCVSSFAPVADTCICLVLSAMPDPGHCIRVGRNRATDAAMDRTIINT